MTDNNNSLDENRTIYVGNLHDAADEYILYELFMQAGPVERISIPKSKDGQSRCFAFVTYVHEISVSYALDLFSETKLFNRQLNLKFRTKRNDSQPTPTLLTTQRQLSGTNQSQRVEDHNTLRQGFGSNMMDPRMLLSMNPQPSPLMSLNPVNMPLDPNILLKLGSQMMFGNGNTLMLPNAIPNTFQTSQQQQKSNDNGRNRSRERFPITFQTSKQQPKSNDNGRNRSRSRDRDNDEYMSRDNNYKMSNRNTNRYHNDKPYSRNNRDSPPRNRSRETFNDRYNRDRHRPQNRRQRRQEKFS